MPVLNLNYMANINNNFKKRKRITKKEALELLKDCYEDIFKAYYAGLANYNEEVNMTIPEARTRLVGPLLNAKITESFILTFPENWNKGKYGRIIFRWNGVLMLIKKLNKNDKPSYIPTILSDSIVNQYQLPLFQGDEGKEEPILIFGYTKDGFGQLVNPRIVLYDDGVQWTAYMEDGVNVPVANTDTQEIVVRLKKKETGEKKAE